MSVSNLVKEAVVWLVKTFGREIVIVAKEAIQHQWQRVFAARNILILGGKQSGKSSLLQYLTSGRPYDIVDGDKRPPAPTALAAIVDKKFALQKGNWLGLKTDVPGDVDLRDSWGLAIADIKPHGIIYMVDGRKSDDTIDADVREIRGSVLAHYRDGLGHLATLHIFTNFSDGWANTPLESQRRLRIVRDSLERILAESTEWAGLRVNIAATQLSPNMNNWEETNRALHHFGADLVE